MSSKHIRTLHFKQSNFQRPPKELCLFPGTFSLGHVFSCFCCCGRFSPAGLLFPLPTGGGSGDTKRRGQRRGAGPWLGPGEDLPMSSSVPDTGAPSPCPILQQTEQSRRVTLWGTRHPGDLVRGHKIPAPHLHFLRQAKACLIRAFGVLSGTLQFLRSYSQDVFSS